MAPEKNHDCELPEDYGGLAKLPPNAPCRAKFFRQLRKLLTPNPNLAISKRAYRNQSQINTERRRHAQTKNVFVIHPYSTLEVFRQLLFVFIGVWEIVTAPLNASFGYIWRYGNKNVVYEANFFTGPNLTVFILEIVWIFSCFFAAYKESKTKTIQLNHWKIVKRYLLTYFLIDLLYLSPPINNDDYEKYIYWINLAVFGRLSTLVTYIKRFLNDLKVRETVVTFAVLITLSFFMVHVLTCVFYVLPLEINFGEEKLWLVKTKLHPNSALYKVYFSCFAMIQSHFWGLGEATQKVEGIMENFILIITMIIGRLWSLYLLARMLRIFAIGSLSESKYEEYLVQLRTFINQKQLPIELENRLIEYYQYKYQHHYFNEKTIYNALSNYLKQELLMFSARNVISKVPVFKFFPRSLIGSIISKCRVLVYLNHDVIANVGDLIENIYFISSGTVSIYNYSGNELAHISDGEEIGMRGVLSVNDTFYEYTYTAIETTELYALSVHDLRAIIYNKSDMLKYFSKKLEDRLEEMVKIDAIARSQGTDFRTELQNGKILERPRIRTRYFE